MTYVLTQLLHELSEDQNGYSGAGIYYGTACTMHVIVL